MTFGNLGRQVLRMLPSISLHMLPSIQYLTQHVATGNSISNNNNNDDNDNNSNNIVPEDKLHTEMESRAGKNWKILSNASLTVIFGFRTLNKLSFFQQ